MSKSIDSSSIGKKFLTSPNSLSKKKYELTQPPLETRNFRLNKPNFLYYTQRERQNINFFEITQPQFRAKQTFWQKNIDFKISSSFHKNFKAKFKDLHLKNHSLHQENSVCLIRSKDYKMARKQKGTLRKKAFKYKNEDPCVGMYNPQPQNFMKRIAKNQIFRRGKSCHILSSNSPSDKQNIKDLLVKKQFPKSNHEKSLFIHSEQKVKDKAHQNFSASKIKLKIKCFDMSKQTSRIPFRTRSNKIQETDVERDYIEKKYKRPIFISAPMNQNQLSGFYERQKKKHRIESSWGILRHINLEDFIKLHRSQVSAEYQNFD